MLDYKYLVFYKVAQNLSFTKASEELFITQPAVTKNIKALETTIGLPLLNRSGNTITLTVIGQTLLGYIKETIRLEENFLFEVNALKVEYSGKLKVGSSTTIAQYILPKTLAKFQEKFSQLELLLHVGNSKRIEEMVLNGEVNIGIVEGISHQNGLTYIPYLKDELVVIASTKSNIAKQDKLSLEGFCKTPLILREHGSGTLEVITKQLNQYDITLSDLQIQLQMGSTEGIKSYLDYAECAGIVSIQSVAKDLLNNRFKIIEVDQLQFNRQFSFVLPQGVTSGLPLLFMDFINRSDYF